MLKQKTATFEGFTILRTIHVVNEWKELAVARNHDKNSYYIVLLEVLMTLTLKWSRIVNMS